MLYPADMGEINGTRKSRGKRFGIVRAVAREGVS